MKILKNMFLLIALMIPVTLIAQMGGPGEGPGGAMSGGGGGRGGHRGMPSIDDQVKHLTKELKLTDTQQTQVKSILQEQRDQMKKLMEDSSGSREDNWSKMREIHQQSSAKIRDLLTDEQKPKYDKLEQERRQRMQERRGGGEGGEGKPEGPPPDPR